MKTPKITITKRYYIYFLLIGLASSFLHEVGHYVAAKLIGIDALLMSLNQTVFLWGEIPKTDVNVGIVLLSGPIVTISICYISLYFLHKQKKMKEVWTAFVLFNTRPVYILASLFFTTLGTHDEFTFFSYMSWNWVYLLFIYAIISYLPLKYIFDNLKMKKLGKVLFLISSFLMVVAVIEISKLIDILISME